jgi:hypothetical protein
MQQKMSLGRRPILAIAAIGLLLAGCDKCGNPVKLNSPAWPKACYGDGAGSQSGADMTLFRALRGDRI